MRNKGEGYVVANGERTIEDDRRVVRRTVWSRGYKDGVGFGLGRGFVRYVFIRCAEHLFDNGSQ